MSAFFVVCRSCYQNSIALFGVKFHVIVMAGNVSLPSRDDRRFRITPVQQMAASCSGALITSLFMTPFDVVKTRLQAQQKAMISNKCFLYCNGLMDHLCPCGPETNWGPRTIHFNGTADAFVKISRLEGITALWSGLSPTLILALPCTVIYFVCYEQLRVRMFDYYIHRLAKSKATIGETTKIDNRQPAWIPLLSGAIARTIAVTVVNPLELVRTKMQSQKLSYAELRVAVADVLKQKGLLGLWRGLSSTLLRDVPFSAIYWTNFETYKRMYGDKNPNNNNFLFNFIGGGLSGSIAAIVTLPLDVVKTYQQIELGEKVLYTDGSAKQRTMGAKETIRHIYRSHGVTGLFTGLTPRILKVAPACAIMIATFEYGKTFFQNYNWLRSSDMLQLSTNKREPELT